MGYPEFKRQFLDRHRENGCPAKAIRQLKEALDKSVRDEMPARQREGWVYFRSIRNSENLNVFFQSNNVICAFSPKLNKIKIKTLAPNWWDRWRNI